jgi:hypothetical protein
MSGAAMWLCVLVGTAILGAGGWAAMKWYGVWAMKRDEAEREKLQAEWRRRAEERKGKAAGQQAPPAEEENGENPPMY